VNGDGETSRDFCYVANVVQANLLAGTTSNPGALGQVYNVAYGARTTLLQLFALMLEAAAATRPEAAAMALTHRPFRDGDVRHSLADVSKARELLGYLPSTSVQQGMATCAAWYARRLGG
jgi:UDP-N-acetylglucosamine 4-epimerase